MYSIGPDPAVNEGNLEKGFAIAAAINIGAAIAGVLTIAVGIGAVIVFGIGVVQALWIGPLYAVYRSKRETETAKGILLAAGYTFLLNAGCWGYVMFPRGPIFRLRRHQQLGRAAARLASGFGMRSRLRHESCHWPY